MPLNVKCRTEDNVRLTAKLCGIIENMNMNLLDFINATVNLQLAEAGGVLKSTQHSPLSCVYGDKSRSNPGSKATVCSLKTSPDPPMSRPLTAHQSCFALPPKSHWGLFLVNAETIIHNNLIVTKHKNCRFHWLFSTFSKSLTNSSLTAL